MCLYCRLFPIYRTVLADINFPTHSLCQGPNRPKEYRADGLDIPTLLNAILQLMPLDWYHHWQVRKVKRVQLNQLLKFDNNTSTILLLDVGVNIYKFLT